MKGWPGVRLRYQPRLVPEELELPLHLLVVGDFRGREDASSSIEDRPFVYADRHTGLDDAFARLEPRLLLTLPSLGLEAELRFSRLADFGPDSVMQQIPELQRVAEVPGAIGSQLDAVLHHPDFQRLEAAWRGLDRLVRRADPAKIMLRLLSCTKRELEEDFEDSPTIQQSGFYHHVWPRVYDGPSSPTAAVLADYTFGPALQDVRLLGSIAEACDEACSVFVAGADPSFFDLESFDELAGMGDVARILSHVRYTKWHSFRDSDTARFVGLAMPRFLARRPYGQSTDRTLPSALSYQESIIDRSKDLLWCNAAFAYGEVLVRAFERDGWCVAAAGPHDGAVEDLPTWNDAGPGRVSSTENPVSARQEFELSEAGFLALVGGRGAPCFFSSASVQKPKIYESVTATATSRAMANLRSVFLLSRLVHYLRVVALDAPLDADATSLEARLNRWLAGYREALGEDTTVRVIPPERDGAAIRFELVLAPGREPPGELRLRGILGDGVLVGPS